MTDTDEILVTSTMHNLLTFLLIYNDLEGPLRGSEMRKMLDARARALIFSACARILDWPNLTWEEYDAIRHLIKIGNTFAVIAP